MKELKLPSGTRLEIYNSITSLTVTRHHEFQKLLLQDAQMGSDIQSVGNHFSMLYKFASHEEVESVKQEAINLHNNLFFMIDGINTKSLCFVALIKTINKKLVTDLSPENARAVVRSLSKEGLTLEMVGDTISEVKKKLLESFNPSFLIDMEEPEMEMP